MLKLQSGEDGQQQIARPVIAFWTVELREQIGNTRFFA